MLITRARFHVGNSIVTIGKEKNNPFCGVITSRRTTLFCTKAHVRSFDFAEKPRPFPLKYVPQNKIAEFLMQSKKIPGVGGGRRPSDRMTLDGARGR